MRNKESITVLAGENDPNYLRPYERANI